MHKHGLPARFSARGQFTGVGQEFTGCYGQLIRVPDHETRARSFQKLKSGLRGHRTVGSDGAARSSITAGMARWSGRGSLPFRILLITLIS